MDLAMIISGIYTAPSPDLPHSRDYPQAWINADPPTQPPAQIPQSNFANILLSTNFESGMYTRIVKYSQARVAKGSKLFRIYFVPE